MAWRWQKKTALPELHDISGAATTPATTPPAGVRDMPRFLGAAGDGVPPDPDWQTDWKAHPPREVWRTQPSHGKGEGLR